MFILTFLTPNFNIVKFHTWIKSAVLRRGEKCCGRRGGTALVMIKQPMRAAGGDDLICSRKMPTETRDDSPAVRLHDPQREITRFKLTPRGLVRGSAEARTPT